MKTPTYSGIITNYNCTAECRHCMFASSPCSSKDYITPAMSENVALLLEQAKTRSVHIGGGEPFMNFDGLCALIEALNRHGVEVDYIETNAYWCKDENYARVRLEKLKALGIGTIMVSVDPYHIEYVPLERPLKLCALLEEEGFDYFIWQQKFLQRLLKLDVSKTHTREELSGLLGSDYIEETSREYGLGINGRALSFADKLFPRRSYEYFATDEECPSLSVPHHCHIDLYGNAIPSRCTGICAEAKDYLTGNIDEEKYPVFNALLTGGTKALYEYARSKGFVPAEKGYPTRCAFCYDTRAYLHENARTQDISDASYYDGMKKYVEFN